MTLLQNPLFEKENQQESLSSPNQLAWSQGLFAQLAVGATALIVGAGAFFSYQVFRNFTLSNLKQNALLEVKQGVDEVDHWLATRKAEVKVLSNTVTVRSFLQTGDWNAVQPYLQAENQQNQEFNFFLVADDTGVLHTTRVGRAKRGINDRPHFLGAMAGKVAAYDPLISRTTAEPSIPVTAPVHQSLDRDSATIGIMGGFVKVDRLAQVVKQLQYGKGSYAFAVNSEGQAIVHPNQSLMSTVEKPAPSLTEAAEPQLAAIVQQMVARQEGIELIALDNTQKYVAFLPLQEANWSIALVIPRQNIESQLKLLDGIAFAVVGLAGTLVAVLVYVQSAEQARLKKAKAEAQTANQLLEQRVAERTQELNQTMEQLQQSHLQLVQSEKMSVLGNLVASVAHEINNPVGFLSGNIQPAQDYVEDLFGLIDLYQQKHPPDAEIAATMENIDLDYLRDDLPKLIGSMQSGIDRIRDISTSLRTFSRADTATPVMYNLHEGLNSTLLILKHRLKAIDERPAIKVIKDYGNIPNVECLAGQVNQVFMNIIANAIDAIDDACLKPTDAASMTNRNQICIKTELSQDEQSVVIRIQDSGLGVADEIKQKIFDHLFTTKTVGKGTGLGLAIAYQIIVEKHAGTLEVDSTPNAGAEFMIGLPIRAKVMAFSR